MNNKILIFSVCTFVAVISWIFFDIQHAQPSVTLNPKINTLLEPVIPTFDIKTLEQVKQVRDLPLAPRTLASPSISPSPLPSPSAQPSPSTQPLASP